MKRRGNGLTWLETLWRDVRHAARALAHSFAMGPDWPPDKTQQVSGKSIFLWVVK